MAVRIPIITTFDKKGVDGAIRNLDNLSRSAGKALGAVGAAVGGGLALSVREFGKFDAAMNQSISIMGDVSDSMRNDMSDAAREVAKQTTFSAEQAAESFFFLASAGLDAEQSVAAMPQVARFAQAGMFDMATATDLATDAQSALGLTSDDTQENLANLTRVTDVFVAANTLANTSVEQLATALTTKAGNALKTVGKDVEEGAAALAVFADQGIKGERAGTLLTNTIFGLTDIMRKAPEEAERLGIEVFNAAGEMNSFADISEDLTAALSSMTKEQQIATLDSLGFTKQAREGTLALIGQSEQLGEYEAALRGAGGTAQEVADKQLNTFNAQMSLLGSAVTDAAIQVGSQLAPTIQDLIPTLERLIPKIGEELVVAVNNVDFEALLTGITNFVSFVADNIDKIDELIVGLAALTLGIKGFTTAIGIARVAAAAFGVTLTVSLPIIGAVGAAIGLLAVGLGAYALSNDEASETQKTLKAQLEQTQGRINKLDEALEAGRITQEGYDARVKLLNETLREQQGELRATYEFTEQQTQASYDARDAAIANRFASENLIPALDNTAGAYNDLAFEATNAKLGVESLTVAEEAQRLMEEQSKLPDHLKTYKSYEQILAEVTAKTRFQTQEQVEFNEKVKQTAIELGLVVPGMNDLEESTRRTSNETVYLTDAQKEAIETTGGLTTEVANLNGVMADGQKANQGFLDLMNGVSEIDTGPSVGQATRDLQALIVEMDKADKLTRAEGGFFEFMRGDAKVTAQFDEAGNLISSFTQPTGEIPATTVTGQQVDLNALNQTLRCDFGDAIRDLTGSNQALNDAILGQTTLINKETGASRTIGGSQTSNAVERAIAEGFEVQEGFQGNVQDLIDTVINIGEQTGVDVALARGGIVQRPVKALVGEAGPEAVIPLEKMSKMGNKTNINITVNTGVGSDPVATGRAVVDAIKRYESTNGKVFVSA